MGSRETPSGRVAGSTDVHIESERGALEVSCPSALFKKTEIRDFQRSRQA